MPSEKTTLDELKNLDQSSMTLPGPAPAPQPPIKLPRFTFITGLDGPQAAAIERALAQQDNSLYLEGFLQPVFDATNALLDATGFDGLQTTREWEIEAYPSGPTPQDIAIEIEKAVRAIASLEVLAAQRVIANFDFNNYQYIFPDATGFDIAKFLVTVEAEASDALVLVGNHAIRPAQDIPRLYLTKPDPEEVLAQLRYHLGTL